MSAPGSPAPLQVAETEQLFAPLAGHAHVLIAISGGPDSVALTMLMASWRAVSSDRPRLSAATVDHGLRPDSTMEAASVATFCSRLKLPHAVLTWDGRKPLTGIQEAARKARYRLLVDRAHNIGADALVTAHTLDDQAETVLIRLARGSGPAGLAAMRPVVMRHGIAHRRPMLGVPKTRLIATCVAQNLPFVIDSANSDARFDRGRWRRLLPLLAVEGLTAERLGRLATRAAGIEAILEARAIDTLERARIKTASATPVYDARLILGDPFDVALRAFAIILRETIVPESGDDVPHMRLDRLERFLSDLGAACSAGVSLRRSIAGTVVTLLPSGQISVEPEEQRCRGRSPRSEI